MTDEEKQLQKRIQAMPDPGHPDTYYPMHIPTAYRNKTLEGYDRELVRMGEGKLDAAIRAAKDGRNILITGGVGTGKTHIAVCLLWFSVRHRIQVGRGMGGIVTVTNSPWRKARFLASIDLQEEMRSAPWKEHEAIAPYTGLDTLLLDDVGAEQRTEMTRTWMGALVDKRYRAGKQTIVTSNLTLEEMAQAIDDRIVSRLIENGVHLRIEGPDYRLTGGKR